jgi:hypothetical protein
MNTPSLPLSGPIIVEYRVSKRRIVFASFGEAWSFARRENMRMSGASADYAAILPPPAARTSERGAS